MVDVARAMERPELQKRCATASAAAYIPEHRGLTAVDRSTRKLSPELHCTSGGTTMLSSFFRRKPDSASDTEALRTRLNSHKSSDFLVHEVDLNSNDFNGSLKRLLAPAQGILPAVQESRSLFLPVGGGSGGMGAR